MAAVVFYTPYEQHTDQSHTRVLTVMQGSRVIRIMAPIKKVGDKWVERNGHHKVAYDDQLRQYVDRSAINRMY